MTETKAKASSKKAPRRKTAPKKPASKPSASNQAVPVRASGSKTQTRKATTAKAATQKPATRTSVEAPAVQRDCCKPVNLALQGGGAHGAFTWGVLDRLLEDDSIQIEAISGTSAGAMNAVALASGLTTGGIEGARASLEQLWRKVSLSHRGSMVQRGFWDMLLGNWSLSYSPGFMMADMLSRVASPYDLNPLSLNPLRQLVDEVVDWDQVHCCNDISLFISATNVRTGRVRVFENAEMSTDTMLASACLPTVFQAIEIDGEHYWDGGYMGNPVLYPFVYECGSADIVIVQINPIVRDALPTSARDILDRVNEITFNASLMKELRAIDFVSRLLDKGHLPEEQFRKMLIHRIDPAPELLDFGAASKFNGEWTFLLKLRDIGRAAAAAWLDAHWDGLGTQSTVDVRAMFQ